MTPTLARLLAIALTTAIFVAGPSAATVQRAAPKRTVRVAAASDLRFALEALAVQFAKQEPDIRVAPVFGSSGTFHAQIQQAAPFDLFLSADAEYPRDLAARGFGTPAGVFVYAIGRLVVWVPQDSPFDPRLGLDVVSDPRVRHVAIANPKHAPYGRAAERALRNAGLWRATQGKLVLGESVTQAAQFAESGAAEVGIIARSLAVAPAMQGKGRYADVPPDSYPALEQGGLVLRTSRDADAAARFAGFITSAAGRSVLDRFGFALPTP